MSLLFPRAARTDTKETIGVTFGAFDLLHPGHIEFLERAKIECDKLLIGLHSDPSVERSNKNKPTQTILERYIQLRGCKFVDQIIPYDTEQDIINILTIFGISKRFLDDNYKNDEYTGKKICEELNIEVVFFARGHNWSSSELRQRLKEV
jgi:glycerol-3-phosphate cytidylyltransferase